MSEQPWVLIPYEDNWWNFENETEEIAFGISGGTPEQRKRYLDYLNEREDMAARLAALRATTAAPAEGETK